MLQEHYLSGVSGARKDRPYRTDRGTAVDSTLNTLRELLDHPGVVRLDETLTMFAADTYARLTDLDQFPTQSPEITAEAEAFKLWVGQLQRYDEILAELIPVIRLGALYANADQLPSFSRLMQTLGHSLAYDRGVPLLTELRQYPLVASIHTAAIGAIVRRNYVAFAAMIGVPTTTTDRGETVPLMTQIGPRGVESSAAWLPSALRYVEQGESDINTAIEVAKRRATYTPISDHLHDLIREHYRNYIVNDREFERVWVTAEILIDATEADIGSSPTMWPRHLGYGRYMRTRRFHSDVAAEDTVLKTFDEQAEAWPPLAGGMFGGDPDRARVALTRVAENAESFRRHLR